MDGVSVGCVLTYEEEQEMSKCLIYARWFDYLVSAPLMLLTLNIIFAATNVAGVILAPVLLAILELGGLKLELDINGFFHAAAMSDFSVFLNPWYIGA